MEQRARPPEASGRAGAGGLLGLRLRDLLLRFPCGLLEGVRWSVLCKAYADRFPDGPPLEPESMRVPAQEWLEDIAEFAEEASSDCRLRLRDAAALQRGSEGQLACWPLLVKTLGEIVRLHGGPQALRETLAAEGAEEGAAGAAAAEGAEAVGVLLSQLKPLLVRHWDPNFQERAVGYFNEEGTFVSVRKMKHLVAAALDWRARRLAVRRAAAVDAVLEAAPPLLLRASQRHNDMVLCCPRAPSEPPGAPPPAPAPAAAAQREEPPSPARDSEASQATRGDAGAGACGPCSPPRAGDAQRADALEKESRRLRIENAELKKRLRFDSELLHKQIRRLRIENAELKKRVFFSGHRLAGAPGQGGAPPPNLPLQPVWVPAPAALFAPVVAGPAQSAASGAAPGGDPATPGAGGTLPASGQVSPSTGSLTPIPHGFCYAVPLAQGMMSPVGQPWPSALGQLVAVPFGTAAAAGPATVMSPFSDRSQQERLLPKSLLGSSGPASSSKSIVSDPLSPEQPGEEDGVGASDPCVHFQGTDDRWVCIPSGIVERHKAQFEAPGAGDGAAEAAPCEPAAAAAGGAGGPGGGSGLAEGISSKAAAAPGKSEGAAV